MAGDTNPPDGWAAHGQVVLHRLGQLEKGQTALAAEMKGAIKEMSDELVALRVDVARFKVWSSILGAGAGAVIGLAVSMLLNAGA